MNILLSQKVLLFSLFAQFLHGISSMRTDFYYSSNFDRMNDAALSHTCMHLLCTAGEGSFVFNGHCYHIVRNDLVVIPMPDKVKNTAAHADMQVEWFAADYKFLQGLLPLRPIRILLLASWYSYLMSSRAIP